jgi:hypothetical protein
MKLKQLEEKIVALEKEVAELKNRQIQYINIPCYLQHYPVYPQPYYPQLPPWHGYQGGLIAGDATC